MQEYSLLSFFLCSILSRFILFTDARERKEEKWGSQGVVVSSVERISLRIAVAPGHFCAASGVEIIGCR